MAQGAHTHHIPGTELTTGMCSGRYPTEKSSFLLPDPSKAVQEAHLRSETREGTHLSVEAIQSEAEISTSYQFSLDPQLLRLLSRSCCFQGPAAHHMCTASFSAYIENQLHFHSILRMQMSYAFCAEQNHYSSAQLLKHWYCSNSLRSPLFGIIFKIR